MDELTKIRNYSQVVITELRDADNYGLVKGGVYPIGTLRLVIADMKKQGMDLPRYENVRETNLEGTWIVAYGYHSNRLARRGYSGKRWTYEEFASYEDAKANFDSRLRSDNHLEASICPVMETTSLTSVSMREIERVKAKQYRQTEREVA